MASFATDQRPSAEDVRGWAGALEIEPTAALEILHAADLLQADPGGAILVS